LASGAERCGRIFYCKGVFVSNFKQTWSNQDFSPEVSDALFELPEPAESPVVTLKQLPLVNQEEF
jgi:hypothetical protein